MRIRISLVQLLLATAFVAVACFAMTHPTELTAVLVVTTTLCLLLYVAIRTAILGSRSSARLRASLILGGGYVALAFGGSYYLSDFLPTSKALDYLYSLMETNPYAAPMGPTVRLSPPVKRVSTLSLGSPPPASSLATTVLPPPPFDHIRNKSRFKTVGHCVFALLLMATPYIVSTAPIEKANTKTGVESDISL
jgi:hypothetical protein